jgi:UV DNA damage endonuclease
VHTFDQSIQRIGFACKIQRAHDEPEPDLNTKSTTISYLQRQTTDAQRAKLWTLLEHNLQTFRRQLQWVSRQPRNQRMFRITSDLLPVYSHDDFMSFYFQPDVVLKLERELGRCGEFAREHDIRLSFHPGQFCVLASDNPAIVENSITEFEYHCDVIRYMGYGRQFQDFKCNVHIGGKQGPEGIKRVMRRLSPEARNCLTIENAEFTWGLAHSLELVDTCALVLDIHHHWIHSGEYIQPSDPRFQRVVDSWRGVRPVIHYSVSREDCLVDHDPTIRPNLKELKSMGFTSAKLRAHSDYYWNRACNEWASLFMPYADIMLEAKQKNLAREKFCKDVGV